MDVKIICLVVLVFAALVAPQEEIEEEKDLEERGVRSKLAKEALKYTAGVLRRNRNSYRAKKIMRVIRTYTGRNVHVDDVIDVIDGVVRRLDRYQKATCNFFMDVAVSVGLPRKVGFAICQAMF